MNRLLTATLVGAALVAQAALAGNSFAEGGRYLLISRVMVPNQSGKVQEQPILLDTETGQTWRLAKDAQEGKTDGAHWVLLDKMFAERFTSKDASTASARELINRRAFGARPNLIIQSGSLHERYDDNP